MTTASDSSAASANAARPENAKPVTIQLRDDVLQKLKIVAILQETTVGELLADAATSLVKRDLKKLLVSEARTPFLKALSADAIVAG